MARFVNRRRWKAKSSRENLAVVLKEVELDHGAEPSDVSLVGAMNGERWCFPGVGHAPEFLVPVRRFLAEQILGKYLAKLTRKQSGWEPLRDEASGNVVLSPAPVSAFVGGDGRSYTSGSLARIANEHGMVFVMFAPQPVQVQVRVGAFNAGMDQNMLAHERHRNSLRRVIAESFNEGDLHLLSLYEVGGHMQGLQHFQINPLDFIDGVLPDRRYDAAAV